MEMGQICFLLRMLHNLSCMNPCSFNACAVRLTCSHVLMSRLLFCFPTIGYLFHKISFFQIIPDSTLGDFYHLCCCSFLFGCLVLWPPQFQMITFRLCETSSLCQQLSASPNSLAAGIFSTKLLLAFLVHASLYRRKLKSVDIMPFIVPNHIYITLYLLTWHFMIQYCSSSPWGMSVSWNFLPG